MPNTPSRGYSYPVDGDAATVPEDIRTPLLQIDADVQGLVDRVVLSEQTVVVHNGDGAWAVTNGLGQPVPVNELGDGTYSIGA